MTNWRAVGAGAGTVAVLALLLGVLVVQLGYHFLVQVVNLGLLAMGVAGGAVAGYLDDGPVVDGLTHGAFAGFGGGVLVGTVSGVGLGLVTALIAPSGDLTSALSIGMLFALPTVVISTTVAGTAGGAVGSLLRDRAATAEHPDA